MNRYTFPIQNQTRIYQDSPWGLFQGLCALQQSQGVDWLHGNSSVQVEPLSDLRKFTGRSYRETRPGQSALNIRGLTPEQVSSLSNRWFSWGDSTIMLGRGFRNDLTPSPNLLSRMVAVKHGTEDQFLPTVAQLLNDRGYTPTKSEVTQKMEQLMQFHLLKTYSQWLEALLKTE